MWFVAWVLLGLALVALVAGLHGGPHFMLGAVGIGVVAAAWFALTAVVAGSASLAWVLFGADLALVGGVGALGLRHGLSIRSRPHQYGLEGLEGQEGVAISVLDPEGMVRVKGQAWSARSLNGRVPKGSPVQVIRVAGLVLEVWGEQSEATSKEAVS